jgi:hypothetical protein
VPGCYHPSSSIKEQWTDCITQDRRLGLACRGFSYNDLVFCRFKLPYISQLDQLSPSSTMAKAHKAHNWLVSIRLSAICIGFEALSKQIVLCAQPVPTPSS